MQSRLTAIGGYHLKGNSAYLMYRCTCGTEKVIRRSSVTSGRTVSCGCFQAEDSATRVPDNTTHGGTYTPEYNVWSKMKGRCLNTKDAAYANYGGRGITVCKEWQDSFEAFYADMGPRPTDAHTIERIDNDQGYFKWNTCWATRTEQANNRRSPRN